jgi:hypothetical protein
VTEQRTLTLIRFVLFTDTILAAFSSALDRLIQQHPESM